MLLVAVSAPVREPAPHADRLTNEAESRPTASVNLGLGSAISVLTILLILVLLYPSIRGILKEAQAA